MVFCYKFITESPRRSRCTSPIRMAQKLRIMRADDSGGDCFLDDIPEREWRLLATLARNREQADQQNRLAEQFHKMWEQEIAHKRAVEAQSTSNYQRLMEARRSAEREATEDRRTRQFAAQSARAVNLADNIEQKHRRSEDALATTQEIKASSILDRAVEVETRMMLAADRRWRQGLARSNRRVMQLSYAEQRVEDARKRRDDLLKEASQMETQKSSSYERIKIAQRRADHDVHEARRARQIAAQRARTEHLISCFENQLRGNEGVLASSKRRNLEAQSSMCYRHYIAARRKTERKSDEARMIAAQCARAAERLAKCLERRRRSGDDATGEDATDKLEEQSSSGSHKYIAELEGAEIVTPEITPIADIAEGTQLEPTEEKEPDSTFPSADSGCFSSDQQPESTEDKQTIGNSIAAIREKKNNEVQCSILERAEEVETWMLRAADRRMRQCSRRAMGALQLSQAEKQLSHAEKQVKDIRKRRDQVLREASIASQQVALTNALDVLGSVTMVRHAAERAARRRAAHAASVNAVDDKRALRMERVRMRSKQLGCSSYGERLEHAKQVKDLSSRLQLLVRDYGR